MFQEVDFAALKIDLEIKCNTHVNSGWQAFLAVLTPELRHEVSNSLVYELMPYGRSMTRIYAELIRRTELPAYYDAYMALLFEMEKYLYEDSEDLGVFVHGICNFGQDAHNGFYAHIYDKPEQIKLPLARGINLLNKFCNMIAKYEGAKKLNLESLVVTDQVAGDRGLSSSMVALARFLQYEPTS
jgi:hypothetical protein